MLKVYQGCSRAGNGRRAVSEAIAHWPNEFELPLQLLLVFHSSRQNPVVVAKTLQVHFPDTPIAGCTTAGELIDERRLNGSLVIVGICSNKIRCHVSLVCDLSYLIPEQAEEAIDHCLDALSLQRADLDPKRHFCLSFIDGLSAKEELLSAALAELLKDILIVGGSAADDLQFMSTWIHANGQAVSHAAALVFVESDVPFTAIKHQHFTATTKEVVVTEADAVMRKVSTLDGRPAAQRYAELVGCEAHYLTPLFFSRYPLIHCSAGETYACAIQRVEQDQSLRLYCAIEEGMVLYLGEHQEMQTTLLDDVNRWQSCIGQAQFLLVCNGILRSLEAESYQHVQQQLGHTLSQLAQHIVGFDAYGEQLSGLHINQALVGLVWGYDHA